MQWRHVLIAVGAFLVVLCIAALWTGIGTGADGEPPAPWLAVMFFVGAGMLVVVLVDRLISVIRGR